jgi:hypothetical protein
MRLKLDPILWKSSRGERTTAWKYRVDGWPVPGQQVFVESTTDRGVWQISHNNDPPLGAFPTEDDALRHLAAELTETSQR